MLYGGIENPKGEGGIDLGGRAEYPTKASFRESKNLPPLGMRCIC